ncbi:MAG: CapA family protein [Lachnospiraceae bacterium]|nr:CapA family protein [Lachnospiraceae bacterium]
MKVLVAGDFCPQYRAADLFEKEAFSQVLGEVKETILGTDYSIVNFECPVVCGDEMPIRKQGPNLKCSEKGIEAIRWAGFRCVSLANNHFFDFGQEGIKNTLEACKKNVIDTVGGGLNLQEASRILYKEINGQTLAIINCCEHEFSIATEKTAGSNPLNPIQQYYAIQEAKKISDYVLVIVHGGHEMWQYPSPRMQETYRFFVDAGADAVVNHHQHCYSGYETYKEKPIFYGIGNFCFDKRIPGHSMWNDGYMVVIHFSDKISFTTIPYSQCGNSQTIHIKNGEEMEDFKHCIASLNKCIADPLLVEDCFEHYCNSCLQRVLGLFSPFSNRYLRGAAQNGFLPFFLSKKKIIRLFDYISCESHRNIVIRCLHHSIAK